VSFTDKLNTITIRTVRAAAPAAASARSTEVPQIQDSAHGFSLLRAMDDFLDDESPPVRRLRAVFKRGG